MTDYEKYQSEYRKKLRAKRKSLGLCTLCGQPSRNGRTLCAACTEKIKARKMNSPTRIPDKWPIGYCFVCGSESLPGRKLCKDHENEYSNG